MEEAMDIDEKVLWQCAEEFLKDHPELDGLVVDDILSDDACQVELKARAAEKAVAEKAKAEKAAKQAEEKAKAEKAAKLTTALAMLRTAHKLTDAELQAKLSPQAAAEAVFRNKLEAAGNPIPNMEQQTPIGVLELKQKYGTSLMGCVYESAKEAVLFTSLLISGAKQYHEMLKKPKLETRYRNTLEDISGQIRPLIDKSRDVIRAWGLDPDNARVKDPQMFYRIKQAATEDTRFSGFIRLITPEDIKLAEADKEVEKQTEAVRAKVRAKIAAMLVAVKMDSAVAVKRAHNLVKNYYDECEGDTGQILRMAAVRKMASAKSEEDQTLAEFYAQADSMSAEELGQAVAELKQAELKKIEKDSVLRELFSWGAEKPETAASRKNKKKGGDNKKGGKNRGKR